MFCLWKSEDKIDHADCPFGLNAAFYPLEAAGIMSENNRMGAPAVVLSWSERPFWAGYHGFGSA